MAFVRIPLTCALALAVVGCEPNVVESPPPLADGQDLSVTGFFVTGFVAAPSGSSTASGTMGDPWDLQTALNGGYPPGTLQAGDTVWLRDGTYGGTGSGTTFVAPVSVAGSPSSPIVFRNYPGERPVINGRLQHRGSYLAYWGLEVMQLHPRANPEWYAVESYGPGGKFINMVLHDANRSGLIIYWPEGDSEVYGSIIYNNGTHQNLDHGIYAQNTTGTARIEHNVVFNNVGYGVHAYTESQTLRNIHVVGNVLFNNGTTGNPKDTINPYDIRPNILLGGEVGEAQGMRADSNFLYVQYESEYEDNYNLWAGYGPTNQDVTIIGNVIWGGNQPIWIRNWATSQVRDNAIRGGPAFNRQVTLSSSPSGQTWSGNQYYASSSETSWFYNPVWRTLTDWESATGLASSGTAIGGAPAAPTWSLMNNKYDPKRALLVIFNWPGGSTVDVSLSAFIGGGTQYEIRNVQSLFGTPVASGTYDGVSVTVPMTGTTPPPFVDHGWSVTPPTTGPYVHAFIVTTP